MTIEANKKDNPLMKLVRNQMFIPLLALFILALFNLIADPGSVGLFDYHLRLWL